MVEQHPPQAIMECNLRESEGNLTELPAPGILTADEASGERVQPISGPPSDLPILADDGLAKEIRRLVDVEGEVLVIANAYTVCVLHRGESDAPWVRVCCGEMAEMSIEAAKPLARKRLMWASIEDAPWEVSPATVATVKGTTKLLNKWFRDAVEATSGREGDVTQAIKDELTYLAGWRCQFEGCGRDLRCHTATGGRGRFSYFAHIVAASSRGPRGDPVRSQLLASDLGNFMLLCDECHRLIDKVNPAKYTVEVLQKMREQSVAEVRRLLDSLQHKPAEIIAIVGNIAGQPAQFSLDDANDALWGVGLRSAQAKPTRYFDPGGQNHDVHSGTYWGSLFQQMKSDLPALQTLLNGTRAGVARPRLAVFPMHSTSVLLLAGRVLGDTAATHLFQPHRNKVGPGTRWAWPPGNSAPLSDVFKVEVLRHHAEGQSEAILVLALTSSIESTRMPSNCAIAGDFLLPTLRITGPTFDKDCIQKVEDLQLAGLAVDAALRRLQDDWRVKKVHLFVSAPASVVVVLGQKMQARHHAEYVCHEAVAGTGTAYKATIEITPTLVRELVTGLAHSLSLQP